MHLFSSLSSQLLKFISDYGYGGLYVFFIFEEGGVPMPIPGDLALVYAGLMVTQHILKFSYTVLWSLAGILTGSSLLFFIFNRGGRPFAYKYGKYILLPQKRIHKLENFFEKYGKETVLIGRFVPGLRVFVSAIAGLSGSLPYKYFILQVFAASVIWVLIFTSIGLYLGHKYLNLVKQIQGLSYVLFVIFIAIIIFEFWRNRKEK